MSMVANKRSIQLVKWLKLRAYIPNLVGKREGKEKASLL